jgi:hypothetical protein
MKGMEEGRGRVVVVFAMAMAMAMLTMTATVMMMATIDYCSLLESDGMIAAILYIFLFIFYENARHNFWATKGMGGGRGIVG